MFFGNELSFHSYEVFIKLILSKYIAAHSLVETIDFDLLEFKIFVFALDEFETFLQLQLKEGMFVDG